MLDNIYPMIGPDERLKDVKAVEETRLAEIIADLAHEAHSKNKISATDTDAIRQFIKNRADESKKLKRAFAHSVNSGILDLKSAEEIQRLISYRNEIAHRTHRITADISRHSIAVDYAAIVKAGYQANALDRIRTLRKEVFSSKLISTYLTSLNSLIFESTERFYENELRRLDTKIRKQAEAANNLSKEVFADTEAARVIFSGNLDPRHPLNFKRPSYLGGEDFKFSNKLTPRGVEVCYQLFESGLKNLAICYLTGLTIRSVQRRRKSWIKVGGAYRTKNTIDK